MKTMSIPIRVVGPGSQPQDEAAQCLDMSRDVDRFAMPRVPERADPHALAEAAETLEEFYEALEAWDPALGGSGPRLNLRGASPAALVIVNQVLGEGEVSIRIDGDCRARIQESVFAGIWRAFELDADDRLRDDWIEAAPLPAIALDAALAAAAPVLPLVEVPDGAMNSPALLAEIRARVEARKRGDPAHVLNLTLFPLTAEDHVVLERALPVGPVAIMSRGFGNCRVTSTLARNVWRVQYFNTMNTLILNTLEVVEAPEVAIAADCDLTDSRERFAELIAWMKEGVD
ncbi:MAG TPA: hydrogenase expression/formation protein [Casimicrobiaceae bacterium]|nr:hydrogenase expression/formation protein [Casimicrobiaceae bacterium]